MTITLPSCKTICLSATLTILLAAGPIQTSYAKDTHIGFYLGVRDDGGHRQHGRNDYHRDYPRRYYPGPRYHPTYSRWNNYRPGGQYSLGYRWDSGRYHRNTDRFLITATGVFFGVLAGSEIIRYMNDVDRLRARDAYLMAQNAPVGNRINWNNPESNNFGSVTATRDGYSESGKYCREFIQSISIGGKTEQAYGVACLQPDGDWQIVQ